jgi:hypothetical protein
LKKPSKHDVVLFHSITTDTSKQSDAASGAQWGKSRPCANGNSSIKLSYPHRAASKKVFEVFVFETDPAADKAGVDLPIKKVVIPGVNEEIFEEG